MADGYNTEKFNPAGMSDAEFAALGAPRLVYVRSLSADDLVAEIPEAKSEIDANGVYYALHGANGQRLAVFASRDEAEAVARENDARTVSLH